MRGRVAQGPVRNPDGTTSVQPLEKVFFAVVNDKWLVRPPEKFPYWHGGSPFVKIVLMRVPFSQVNKAVYDTVVPLNYALNEMANLIFDGGIASVWGVREIRTDWLANPEAVEGGLAQGMTLALNSSAPPNASAITVTKSGEVPRDAMAVYQMLEQEILGAALTNDIKSGQLPPKRVVATEIVAAEQNQGAVMDSIVADMEIGIAEVLQKSYMTALQYAPRMQLAKLAQPLGTRAMLKLLSMTEGQRFRILGRGNFKVFGLTETLSRSRDFTRLMALLQVVSTNPAMMYAFLKEYSPTKILRFAMRLLNINPERFQRDPQEKSTMPNELQTIMSLFGMLQSGGGGGTSTRPTGEPGTPSEINQAAGPSQVQ